MNARGGPLPATVTFSALMALASWALGQTNAPAPIPLEATYAGYKAEFTASKPAGLMDFSVQPTFYNRAEVGQDERVDALIREGLKCESRGEWRDAIKHYQTVIGKFPDAMLQMSEYGVFVPASRYAQQRLLKFPP